MYIIFSIGGNIFSAAYIFYTNYVNNFWQYPQYFNYSTALVLIIILFVLKKKFDKGEYTKNLSLRQKKLQEFEKKSFRLSYQYVSIEDLSKKVIGTPIIPS